MGLGAFNEVSWYGVGDADECWIIATYWALVASGVMKKEDLPTIAAFRDAAGVPDRKGPTGGNNADLALGLKTLVPQADAVLFSGHMPAFKAMLARGYVASLSLRSSALPSYLQFGFKGLHQVSIFYQGGKYYVMNPLAKAGSALVEISRADLMKAAGALNHDNRLHAIFIKPKKQQDILKMAKKGMPVQPRDLNAPIIVRNYIDPMEALSRLNGRRPKYDKATYRE